MYPNTMLMIEPKDFSGNFSNLVIQQYNEEKRIFTVRYFTNQTNAKLSSYASKSSTDSFSDIQMRSGITTDEMWPTPDEDGGGSGSGSDCDEYEKVCHTVNVWIPVCCGCGHCGDTPCDGCYGNYAGWTLGIEEECENICILGGPDYDPSSGTGTSTGSGSSPSNPTEPTNVATTPINPDGASATAEALNNLLISNPFLLLEIDCDQIENWQTLAQHTAPQSVQDKVKNLQENHEALLGDWNIQYLESAGGKVVNMDYFSVNITTLPNNPSTGQQFTPQQFLDYFRRNINNFVNGTTFEPYCEISAICQQETNLWNSNNPLGAIIKLDISLYNGPGGNILANDGVVVCAEYTSDYWRFMTMEAPYDSSHPVTGTRQFGMEQNPNGSYNIYVRGVDRFTSRIQEAAIDIFTEPFLFADNLWENFQEKTNSFVNANGGSSSVNTPIHNRPDWEKVKDVLEGRKPISDLGCN